MRRWCVNDRHDKLPGHHGEDRTMPDEEQSARTAGLIIAEGLPPPGTPVAFADGVTNLANSKHLVKFYLYRTDPTVDNSGPAKNNIVVQVVMPIDGFVRTAAFLNKGIDQLISNGALTQIDVDNLRSE
jgi:hypothetical protein